MPLLRRARFLRWSSSLGLAAVLAVACAPVVPVETPDSWRFEGFPVHSYIPDEPVGIVYLFHGSNGSAGFALGIETIDQTNELVERGYGWVATESTERTGDKRWDVNRASLTANPDLARLTRLHDELIATSGVDATTPIFGIGMSNGARMVTLFGQSFSDAGYPVAAVAPFMGRAAPSVKAAGGLTVPGFWVVAENDTVVPPLGPALDRAESAALGTPTELIVKREEPLLSARFTRIPAIDAHEAIRITELLRSTGVWDDDGQRVVSVEEALAVVAGLPNPGFGASSAEIRSQVQAILAAHQFVGLFREGLADFFDAQLP